MARHFSNRGPAAPSREHGRILLLAALIAAGAAGTLSEAAGGSPGLLPDSLLKLPARAWRAWSPPLPPPEESTEWNADMPYAGEASSANDVLQLDERYELSLRPYDMAIGDLNGDGRPDLAASTDAGLTLRYQSAGGDFDARQDVPLPDAAAAIGIGDFDGDGLADIVCGLLTHELVVVRNVGAGQFALLDTHPTAPYPGALAIGDFDGDGLPDVALASPSENVVQAFINAGGGSFAAPVNHAVGVYPGDLVAADFDGDGWIDLASANWGSPPTVSALLNQGDGTFASHILSPLSANAAELAAGDIDEDGILDLAVGTNAGLRLLENDGSGGFVERLAWDRNLWTMRVALGDIDGDGHLDVAALFAVSPVSCYRPSEHRCQVFYGDGTWNPQPHGAYLVAPLPTRTFASDLRGIGRADVVTLCGAIDDRLCPDGSVSILRSQGTRRLPSQLFMSVPGAGSVYDGNFLHLVSSVWIQEPAVGNGPNLLVGLDNGIVRVFNRGDGTFEGGEWLGNGLLLDVRDVNGDGLEDLAVALGDTLEIRLGQSDGSYQDAWRHAPLTLRGWIDANADGLPEIAEWNESAMLTLRPNLGGVFGSPVATGIVNPHSISSYRTKVGAGDLDGDGIEEVLIAFHDASTEEDSVTICRRSFGFEFEPVARLPFAPPGWVPWSTYHPNSIIVEDFEGDGQKEIAILASSFDSGGYVSLLGWTGGWNYQVRAHVLYAGKEPTGMVAVDLDADGLLDVCVSDANTNDPGRLNIFMLGMDGQFQALPTQFPGDFAVGVASADFDRDGRPDLAVASRRYGYVSLFFNAAEPPVPTSTLATLIRAHTEADRVELLWHTPLPEVWIERSTPEGWHNVAKLRTDGAGFLSYVDIDVRPGERAGWRLAWPAGHALPGSEAWVEVPQRGLFALRPRDGNPTRSSSPAFVLAMESAGSVELEVLDLAGRAIQRTRSLLPAGESVVTLPGPPLAPGIYWARASHAESRTQTRIVVLR